MSFIYVKILKPEPLILQFEYLSISILSLAWIWNKIETPKGPNYEETELGKA